MAVNTDVKSLPHRADPRIGIDVSCPGLVLTQCSIPVPRCCSLSLRGCMASKLGLVRSGEGLYTLFFHLFVHLCLMRIKSTRVRSDKVRREKWWRESRLEVEWREMGVSLWRKSRVVYIYNCWSLLYICPEKISLTNDEGFSIMAVVNKCLSCFVSRRLFFFCRNCRPF